MYDLEVGKHYAVKVDTPATHMRLIVGLTYLQFIYAYLKEILIALVLFAHKTYELIMVLLTDCYSKAKTRTNNKSKSTRCWQYEPKKIGLFRGN